MAGARLQTEVVQLKRVLRLALSVHNPEDHYEKSDYYGFVQRLFQPNLVDLREDVAVLSFNYDVYLEFLLQRAVRVREQVTKGKYQTVLDQCTSGFSNRNIQQLEASDGFCLLKLHGATAWPTLTYNQASGRDSYCWYGDLFDAQAANRISMLTSLEIGQSDSPIVFPWEIMDDEAAFIKENAFPCHDGECLSSRFPGGYNGTTTLFQLFKSIWTRARAEVLAANKISIVGLSLHEYLNPGFNFLFAGKEGNIDLVVADKSLKRFMGGKESDAHFDPLTPVSRLARLLGSFCPSLTWNVPQVAEGLPRLAAMIEAKSRKPIRLHASFEDFILNELGTQATYQGVIQTSEDYSCDPRRVGF